MTGAILGRENNRDVEVPEAVRDEADVNAATAAIPVTAHPVEPADRGPLQSHLGRLPLLVANVWSHINRKIALEHGNRLREVEVELQSVVTRRQVIFWKPSLLF